MLYIDPVDLLNTINFQVQIKVRKRQDKRNDNRRT